MNPLRTAVDRAFTAALASIAKDGEALLKRAEAEATAIKDTIAKGTKGIRDLVDEMETASNAGRNPAPQAVYKCGCGAHFLDPAKALQHMTDSGHRPSHP